MPPNLNVDLHQPYITSSSDEDDTNLGVAKPHVYLNPCIAEFLRTAYLPLTITLLVASIRATAVSSPHDAPPRQNLQAYRLVLTDGDRLIQAVLSPEMHRFVIMEEVVEGSVVKLVGWEIQIARRAGHGSDEQRAGVVYLAISNFQVVAFCENYKERYLCRANEPIVGPDKEDNAERDADRRGKNRPSPSKVAKKKIPCFTEPSRQNATEPISITSNKETVRPKASHHIRSSTMKVRPAVKIMPATAPARPPVSTFNPRSSRPLNTPTTRPPSYPSTITSLSKIPYLTPPQGLRLSVLAVILSVSSTTVPRPRLGLKRDVRLIDSSLPPGHRGINLSVWIEAEWCLPTEGTVALFRGVRNHLWEGGSLNAWGNDCGVDWRVDEEDVLKGVGGVEHEGKRLRAWWEREGIMLWGKEVVLRE